MTFKKLVVVEVIGNCVAPFLLLKSVLHISRPHTIICTNWAVPFPFIMVEVLLPLVFIHEHTCTAGIWWQCGMFLLGSHSYWGWCSLTYWRYLLSVCPTKRRPKVKEESLESRQTSQRLWVFSCTHVCCSWAITFFSHAMKFSLQNLDHLQYHTYMYTYLHIHVHMYNVCGPGQQCGWCVMSNRRISRNSKGDVFCNICCPHTKNWHQCLYWELKEATLYQVHETADETYI